MEISQLIYFKVVARTQNFSKAAEEIHVSQPAISMSIKKLEDELGVQLFEKKKKTLMLTDIGEKILTHVNTILSEMNNINAEVSDYVKNTRVSLRLGIPLLLYSDLLYPLQNDFSLKHRNVELCLSQYGSDVIIDKILDEKLDLGIICQPNIPNGLTYTTLETLEFYVYLSPEHPYSQYEQITPDMLAKCNLLISDADQNKIAYYIVSYLKEHNIDYISTHKGTLTPQALLLLTTQNEGVAILEKNVSIDKQVLVRKPLDPPLHIPMVIVWKKNSHLTSYKKDLISYIKKAIRS